ncbi:MAG: DUF4332 domain-containing protein [Candidatus Cloacimonetes bacterium]|nr:DUF4332 domain-containing protein [Candidatus Cloacimonadota bacterium]
MADQEKIKNLCRIPGIGDKIAQLLIHSGFDSVDKLNIELNQDNFDEEEFQRRLLKHKKAHDACPSVDSIKKWKESINEEEYLYTIAKERYNSLMERSFEKTLMIYLYKFKLPEVANWSESNPNERNKLTCGDVKTFKIKLDEKELNLFPDRYKEDYEDMKKIRKRNEYFNFWLGDVKKNKDKETIKNNKEVVKKMKIKFKNYFENELNFDEFKKEIFFKDNEKDKRICYYCGISEAQIEILVNEFKIRTKRFYSRGKTMEIDQREPEKGYNESNIVLACYWCNNAKSDEFDEYEFIPIAKEIKKALSKRLNQK